MDWLFKTLSETEIYGWEEWIGAWFFYFSIAFLIFELIRYLTLKQMRWSLVGDTITNYLTLFMFLGRELRSSCRALYHCVLHGCRVRRF